MTDSKYSGIFRQVSTRSVNAPQTTGSVYMNKLEELNIVAELWKTHGVLALGWIVAFFEGAYIILLHRRTNSIYQDYVNFAKTQAEGLVPVLEKNAIAMEQAVRATNETADHVHSMNSQIQTLVGEISLVVRTFVEGRMQSLQGKAEARASKPDNITD